MKTIFIFGAGASRQAGGPLMSDFLDKAYDLIRLKTQGVIESSQQFETVFSVVATTRSDSNLQKGGHLSDLVVAAASYFKQRLLCGLM